MSWWFWAGLIVVVILILIPAVMLLRVGLGIAGGTLAHLRSRARTTRCEVPGLGEMRTDDGRSWSGDVDGISVTIETGGGPPTPESARLVLAALQRFDALAADAVAFLYTSHADVPTMHEALEAEGLVWRGEGAFDIEFGAGEWSHQVHFRDGVPKETSSMH